MCPSQCKKVTNRQPRIDNLKKSYRCFLYLKSGHALKTCSANVMRNTIFLFLIKEKIEIAMARRMTVRIVLLLLSFRGNPFLCKLQEQMYLEIKLKVL